MQTLLIVTLMLVAMHTPVNALEPQEVADLLSGQDIYYDDDGLIVHKGHAGDIKGWDGGDTAQREGWYWLGVWIREHELHDPWPIKREKLKTLKTLSAVIRSGQCVGTIEQT